MEHEDFDAEDWASRIQAHRAEKDEFFATDPNSPIPDSERDAFDGLRYFPLDESYRFEATYTPRSDPESVTLGASTGPDMEFEQVGNVGLSLDGDLYVLAVYAAPGVEDGLVPFRDGTNGTETWEHGRYLSIEIPDIADRMTDTPVVLDFNLAYHPFCVYDDAWVSMIPPTDAELPVDIRAGERL